MSIPTNSSDEVTAELHGVRVIITRSGGGDGAIVVYIDGPDGDADTMPDGSPRMRILLNDDPVYVGTPYEPTDD